MTNSAISCSDGLSFSLGGIWPLLTFSRTSPQRWASAPDLKSRESRSIRTSLFSFWSEWQDMQCF